MAKGKLVAKVNFDDGTKKGSSGKSQDYMQGEAYQGDASQAKEAVKKGLLCSESELEASKEVLDEKDKVIKSLEDKLAEAHKTQQALEQAVIDLKAENAELKKEQKPSKKE